MWSGGPLLGVPLPGKATGGVQWLQAPSTAAIPAGQAGPWTGRHDAKARCANQGVDKMGQAELCLARLDPGEGETGIACPPLHRPVPPGQSP